MSDNKFIPWTRDTYGVRQFDATTDSARRARDIIHSGLLSTTFLMLTLLVREKSGGHYRELYNRAMAEGSSLTQTQLIIDELWSELLRERESGRLIHSKPSLQLYRFLNQERSVPGSVVIRPMRNHEFFHAFLGNMSSPYNSFLILSHEITVRLEMIARTNANKLKWDTGDTSWGDLELETLEREVKIARDPLTFVEESIAQGRFDEGFIEEFTEIVRGRISSVIAYNLYIYGMKSVPENDFIDNQERLNALAHVMDEVAVFANLNI